MHGVRGEKRSRGGGERRVVIVGGGVSGCSCAAKLAGMGVPVTVVSSALDSVGLPGYGPVLAEGRGAEERARETLARLEPALGEVWIEATGALEAGEGFLYVDRRMVSVETKRALEWMPGLLFRQALITGVKVGGDGVAGGRHFALESAFGESIEADALVLAVGLGVDGQISVGQQVLPGGRYGETAAVGLRRALGELGVVFREGSTRVGRRFGMEVLAESGLADAGFGDSREDRAWLCAEIEDRSCGVDGSHVGHVMKTVSLREARKEHWDAGYPPSPYWSEGLAIREMVVEQCGKDGVHPVLSPDGLATGEVYEHAGELGGEEGPGSSAGRLAGPGDEDRPMATRLEQAVVGLVADSASRGGRLRGDGCDVGGVWIAGRFGGATNYVESLASGTAVAEDIARFLGKVEDDG